MTLLSIAQDVADEIGIVRPTKLVGSADLTARRMLASARAAGQALYRAHNWSVLHREHTFSTEADVANYAVPDDFGRLIRQTAWDRDSFRRMRGSKTSAEWQRLKSSLVESPMLLKQYRLQVGPLSGSVLIDPTPDAAGETLVYEYVSRFWSEDSGGTGQAELSADTDEIRLDHEVFRLGLLWRTMRSLGNEYLDQRADYDVALKDAIRADMALETTNTRRRGPTISPANLPEGDWTL